MRALGLQAFVVLAVSVHAEFRLHICYAEPSGKSPVLPPRLRTGGTPLASFWAHGPRLRGLRVLGLGLSWVRSGPTSCRVLSLQLGLIKKTARPYTLGATSTQPQDKLAALYVVCRLALVGTLAQVKPFCSVFCGGTAAAFTGKQTDMIAGTASLMPACGAQVC